METGNHKPLPNNNICKNCNNAGDGNFCSNCGQSTNTHPINFHYLLHDMQHTLLPVDKGFFYTLKELFTRPGHTIREFIDGKRVLHFKPLALVLVLAGAYGFLYQYFHIDEVPRMAGKPEMERLMSQMNAWMAANYSVAELMLIPFFALGSYIVFRKSGYNYVQNLVISMFLTAQRLVISLLLLPLALLYSGDDRGISTGLASLIGLVLYIWSFIQLFNTRPKFNTGLKALWAYLFSLIIMLVLFMAGGVIIGLLFLKK